MIQFSGNQPGTGGLVTFKDSNWLMSIVLAHQPHFRTSLPASCSGETRSFPDRVGIFVPKPTAADCNGADFEGALRAPAIRSGDRCIGQLHSLQNAYITSMFMPRTRSDRPLPVPRGSKKLAFISQFVPDSG